MTSAARPTWSAALGSGSGLRDGSSAAPTLQTCAKDQPGHLKLKMRDLLSETTATEAPKTTLIIGDSDEEIGEASKDDKNVDADGDGDNEKETLDSQDSLTDDDDDEEELMRELEKIKREREAERLARELKEAESDPHVILAGNPLLSSSNNTSATTTAAAFGVKRRWDDDVVFKNQARGIEDRPQKRFINDTTRSDFHRRFLDKFIR